MNVGTLSFALCAVKGTRGLRGRFLHVRGRFPLPKRSAAPLAHRAKNSSRRRNLHAINGKRRAIRGRWLPCSAKSLTCFARRCIDALRRCIDALRRCIDALRRCIDALRRCIHALRRCIDALRRCIHALRRCIHALRRCIDALRRCIDALRRGMFAFGGLCGWVARGSGAGLSRVAGGLLGIAKVRLPAANSPYLQQVVH